MSVDLRKLIAKKTYLVAMKSSKICKKLLNELNATPYSWRLKTKLSRSATFGLNYKEHYAFASLAYEGKPRTKENLALKRAEYDMDPIKCATFVQQRFLDEIPVELMYIVLEESVAGCIVKAICKPILYFKIVREIPYQESDPQNIRIQCEEFLDHIFIGGLGAKEISEETKITRWELLINDINNRQITERIYEMLRDATTCVLMMGWIGTDCLPKLNELKNAGVTIRVVTHKPGEFKASPPKDIQKGYAELIKLIGLNNISVNPLLHGRALIVDNKALVGSMDLNAYSLSGQHVEFAIYTEDVDTVRRLRSYFESMFKPLKEAEK